MNKIGPYHNPQETYGFYSLPFCIPPAPQAKPSSSFGGIGEVLEGNQLVHSGLSIQFKKDTTQPLELCSQTLSQQDAEYA